jgi:hypothetical protein
MTKPNEFWNEDDFHYFEDQRQAIAERHLFPMATFILCKHSILIRFQNEAHAQSIPHAAKLYLALVANKAGRFSYSVSLDNAPEGITRDNAIANLRDYLGI